MECPKCHSEDLIIGRDVDDSGFYDVFFCESCSHSYSEHDHEGTKILQEKVKSELQRLKDQEGFIPMCKWFFSVASADFASCLDDSTPKDSLPDSVFIGFEIAPSLEWGQAEYEKGVPVYQNKNDNKKHFYIIGTIRLIKDIESCTAAIMTALQQKGYEVIRNKYDGGAYIEILGFYHSHGETQTKYVGAGFIIMALPTMQGFDNILYYA